MIFEKISPLSAKLRGAFEAWVQSCDHQQGFFSCVRRLDTEVLEDGALHAPALGESSSSVVKLFSIMLFSGKICEVLGSQAL